MNLKWKLLAAAVAIASAAPVSATISSGSNGELFFSLWDPGANLDLASDDRSYTRDLGGTIGPGTTADGTLNNWASATGIPPTIPTAKETAGSPVFSIAPDAALTSFLAGTSNPSKLQWNIAAVDTSGARRILTTSTAILTGANMPLNTNLADIASQATVYLGGANALGTHGTATTTNGSNTFDGDGQANAGGSSWGSSFGGRVSFSNFASLGANSFFYLIYQGTDDLASAGFHQYVNQNVPTANAYWTFNANGDLTYTVPAAAIPEPGAWAMLVAGLMGIGAVTRRRLS